MQGVRSGKLKLKGDKSRPSARVEKTRSSTHRVKQEDHEADEAPSLWTDLRGVEHLKGPMLLLSVAPEERSILVISEEGIPSFKTLSELQISSECPEPTDPNQVLLARSLVKEKFVFKTPQEKYMSSDSLGKVTASKAAVGPSEEWRVRKIDAGFVFEDYLGRYLSIDKITGRIRADSESIGPQEAFQLRCQTTEIREAGAKADSAQRSSTIGNLNDLEVKESGKYVSWGSRKKPTSTRLSNEELNLAQASGRLHEALLERRMKSKHDPFC